MPMFISSYIIFSMYPIRKLFIIVLGLMVLSCGSRNRHKAPMTGSTSPQDDTLNTKVRGSMWTFTSFFEEPIDTTLAHRSQFKLAFHPKQLNFSAAAGCNTVGGEYEKNHAHIQFKLQYATEMICDHMTYEEQLYQVLQQTDSFYRADPLMTLFKNGKPIAHLQQQTVADQ